MAEPIESSIPLAEGAEAATEVFNSVKVSLADLCARGTAQYAHKNYEDAAELYSRAAELQSELNGEMSPENAEILFLYGRALFKVGQGKSDVLGGKAGGEKQKKNNGSAKPKKQPKTEDEQIIEEGVAIVAQENGAAIKPEQADAKKPLFQFTGDENFEDSEDEEEDAEAEDDEDEDEDDLASAFEALDLARVLFERKLQEGDEAESKGKSVGDSQMTKHIKERLGETHDLMAEISLENERFPNAVTDFRSALTYKVELYSEESEIIAEAHFKLSLALEFASINQTKDDEAGEEGNKELDQGMRDEAIKELELAIQSTTLKLQSKQVELATSNIPDDNDITREQIADVKEMVSELEGRLAELKGPLLDVKSALYGPDSIPMGGILGAMLGESPNDAAARVEEAKKTATDLTGIVRKKDKKPTAEPSTNGNGKRRIEDEDEVEAESAKKAKVEGDESEGKEAMVEDADGDKE